jgi:hypothetical protein
VDTYDELKAQLKEMRESNLRWTWISTIVLIFNLTVIIYLLWWG